MTHFFNVDSRLLDRLNAACGVLMAGAAVVLLVMALQPSLNPASGHDGYLTIELKGPERTLTAPSEGQAAAETEPNTEVASEAKTMDAATSGG